MSKRLLLVPALTIAFAFLPALANADDMPPTAQPDAASAAGLGPTSTAGSAGGSNADSGTLQPAGTSPLQSTTNDSTGLTAPASNVLQAPVTPDETLRVVMGDADGASHSAADNSNPGNWAWLVWTLILAVIIPACVFLLPRLRLPNLPQIRLPRRPH